MFKRPSALANYLIKDAKLQQRSRASEFITPFKVIQGHWFWYQLKPVCDFMLVNRTVFKLAH